jgi:hypothetical protein
MPHLDNFRFLHPECIKNPIIAIARNARMYAAFVENASTDDGPHCWRSDPGCETEESALRSLANCFTYEVW